MATNLAGYGPHTITADGDYDLKCTKGREGRSKRLTIGFDVTGGNFTIKSREEGSSHDFVTQSYTKADESEAATAISADTVVSVDCTGKDIRITGAGTSTGTLTFSVESES